MSNLNLTDDEIKERLIGELGLDTNKQYTFSELMQMWLATGQPFDKGALATLSNGSGQMLGMVHNTPVYNSGGGFIWVPPTDRYTRLDVSGYVLKATGNTTRGIARCQLYNMPNATAQDSGVMLVPLENLANEGIGVLRASFEIHPSNVGRIFGAAWDVFQYAGALGANLYNGAIGGLNLQTQLRAYTQ